MARPKSKNGNTNGNQSLEAKLWEAADELRANSKLKASEYSVPVLGLIFLRYADAKFQAAAQELKGKGTGRRKIGSADYQAMGVLYLPEVARFSALIQLPEGGNIGGAIKYAMRAIETENPDLKDVLPKTYNHFENALLKELLKTMNSVPMDIEGDAFGKIYEYFLGHFAMSEGQKGAMGLKIQQMVSQNRTRMDFMDRFQRMIDEYNSGSVNVEEFFRQLMGFAADLNKEEQRAVGEMLSEEELVLFDLLTKPSVELTAKELDQVKATARSLLVTLKAEKLVLDWRKLQQARAEVRVTIEQVMDSGLPEAYSPELFEAKAGAVYQHVYEAYYGAGMSIYSRIA